MSAQVLDDEVLNEGQSEVVDQVTDETPVQEEDIWKDVPDKYRNKSIKDLVRMHQEAENLIGKHANEVGEIRSLADQLIRERFERQQNEASKSKVDELSEVDFFADPAKAVEKAVSQHPAVLQAQQTAMTLQKQMRVQELQKKYPDFQQRAQDPFFLEWVKKSPSRTRQLLNAHQNFDVADAIDLFDTYEDIKASRAEVAAEGAKELKEMSKNTLKNAVTPSGGSGESGKKTYRRADLIRLQIQDPDRYMQLQDEIMAAYAEGRVR